MIYFLTLKEGGRFIKICDRSRKPESVVRYLKKLFPRFVVLFKCGMLYDSILKGCKRTCWRHVLIGGRKFHKQWYKQLLEINELISLEEFTNLKSLIQKSDAFIHHIPKSEIINQKSK